MNASFERGFLYSQFERAQDSTEPAVNKIYAMTTHNQKFSRRGKFLLDIMFTKVTGTVMLSTIPMVAAIKYL